MHSSSSVSSIRRFVAENPTLYSDAFERVLTIPSSEVKALPAPTRRIGGGYSPKNVTHLRRIRRSKSTSELARQRKTLSDAEKKEAQVVGYRTGSRKPFLDAQPEQQHRIRQLQSGSDRSPSQKVTFGRKLVNSHASGPTRPPEFKTFTQPPVAMIKLNKHLLYAVEQNSMLRAHVVQQGQIAEAQEQKLAALFALQEAKRFETQELKLKFKELKHAVADQVSHRKIAQDAIQESKNTQENHVEEELSINAVVETEIARRQLLARTLEKEIKHFNQLVEKKSSLRKEIDAKDEQYHTETKESESLTKQLAVVKESHAVCPVRIKELTEKILDVDAEWQTRASDTKKAYEALKVSHRDCGAKIAKLFQQRQQSKGTLKKLTAKTKEIQAHYETAREKMEKLEHEAAVLKKKAEETKAKKHALQRERRRSTMLMRNSSLAASMMDD